MELIVDQYLAEFIVVLTITVLAIMTPGPDFLIVVRNSLTFSKRSGVFTALGVASAVWVHISYTLAGIGVVLSKSILLFSVVKYLGAAYLMYLGWACLRSKRMGPQQYTDGVAKAEISDFTSFKTGFINNALNPKATLFFLSLFTQVVSAETPLVIQLIYGATVSVSCFIWFSLVSMFLNQNKIRTGFESIQYYFEKLMGAVLIAFGLKVALSVK